MNRITLTKGLFPLMEALNYLLVFVKGSKCEDTGLWVAPYGKLVLLSKAHPDHMVCIQRCY